MSDQGMRKECNFCGARFAQGVKLCPNCGSADIKLVAGESVEFLETDSAESEKSEQFSSATKKPKKKWKKTVVILVSVLVVILVMLISISQILRWVDKNKEAERWTVEEKVKSVLQYDGDMSNEEWKEKIFPLLDELYSMEMDEELSKMFDHAVTDNRPIYDWDHYLYASSLVDFYIVNGIWEYEQSAGSLKDYHNTQLLYYCLEYIEFEEREEFTAEEKERLQRYVINLRNDVTKRFNLTEEELAQLYAEAIEEYGYVDYFAVERFLKERAGINQEESEEDIKQIENLEEALKRAESLHGAEWKSEMFSILDQLYEQQQYKMIYDIYKKTQEPDTNKPITQWEHYLFVRALYDIYDIEKVLEAETAGKKVKEWEYVNILIDYFEFEDFENRTNLTEEEKEKLMPLVFKLRDDAQSRWELSEKGWGELRNRVVSEYDVIIYEEAEIFVEDWMERKGYANDGDTINEELINANGMDDDIWEKKFYPKFDKLYETGTDEALYEISRMVSSYGRSMVGWQHNDYVEMLECYYNAERVWRYEDNDSELEQRDYTQLLYTYLVFENLEERNRLSSEELEKLNPYREKIRQDSTTRWNFTEEDWKEIEENVDRFSGNIYWYEVNEFIEKWLEGK